MDGLNAQSFGRVTYPHQVSSGHPPRPGPGRPHPCRQPPRPHSTAVIRRTALGLLFFRAPERVSRTYLAGIRIDARDHIEPTFRVPAVRIDYGYMEPTELRSNRSARLPDGRMALDDAG